ncbi:hypothetical protein BASA61_004210 [Batrachochytrium salamandrivorans]|nr:hypothetical protein BASA61_004210 [Batrachochytrium salamandrivorans]
MSPAAIAPWDPMVDVEAVSYNYDSNELISNTAAFGERDEFMAGIAALWVAVDNALATNPLGTATFVWSSPMENQLHRLLYIMDKYLEMPQLLDPYIENIVTPIITRLLAGIKAFHTHPRPLQMLLVELWRPFFTIVCHLAKNQGYKTVLHFFTHEVSDLEPCLDFLQFLGPEKSLARHWQSRYVLLLWVSLIAMVPFDLTRVDSGKADGRMLVDRMLDVGKQFLDSPGKEYEGASIFIMRILSRKDSSQTHLLPFIEESFETIRMAEDIFTIRGVMAALCSVYKYGPRSLLLSTVHHVGTCCNLMSDRRVNQNALMRKQVVKLAQRIALCAIKPRVASWRYQRGSRSLAENLAFAQGDAALSKQNVPVLTKAPITTQEAEAYDEIPDEIEDIINVLLNGLRDKDTIVRWTSAKGVGRISNRLSKDYVDDIVGSIIEILSEDVDLIDSSPLKSKITGVSDASWHGSCLALAELIRRGLLLPDRLKECIPWILRGLTFDQRKGKHSVGSHVRDAACYVCWSLARAYAPDVLAPYAMELAQSLVVVSLTDREINIRRASAAAFQENVGRHGLFPHGITIVGIADYFSLGNRTNVYTEISPTVAKYPEYASSIINYLATSCREHWDMDMRILSSKSIGILTSIRPDYVTENVLSEMIKGIHSQELEIRHASLLFTAEILHTLSASNNGVWPIYHLENYLKPAFFSLKAFHPTHTESFGSDLTRIAGALLIEVLASSGAIQALSECEIEEFDDVLAMWWLFLDSSIDRSEEVLQKNTAQAICCLSKFAGISSERFESYIRGLAFTSMPTRRRGVALVFASATLETITPNAKEIIQALSVATHVNKDQVYNDAEARRNAIHALTSISLKYNRQLIQDLPDGCLGTIISTLLAGTEDYSTDSRGDVGSWIREASIHGLVQVLTLVSLIESEASSNIGKPILSAIDSSTRRDIVANLCLQSVEKIDRLRGAAGVALHSLLWEHPTLDFPSRDAMQCAIPLDLQINWLNTKEVYPLMSKIMCIDDYANSVLLGIIVSIGGLTESLVRSATSSLMEFVLLFGKFKRDERVSISILEVLDLLLTRGVILSSHTRHVVALFDFTKAEVLKSKNVRKLTVGIKVFAGFAGLVDSTVPEVITVQKRSLNQLILYLAHPYPKVRRAVSEALYLVVSTSLQQLVISADSLEMAEDVLLTTDWDSAPLEDLKGLRSQIQTSLEY